MELAKSNCENKLLTKTIKESLVTTAITAIPSERTTVKMDEIMDAEHMGISTELGHKISGSAFIDVSELKVRCEHPPRER